NTKDTKVSPRSLCSSYPSCEHGVPRQPAALSVNHPRFPLHSAPEWGFESGAAGAMAFTDRYGLELTTTSARAAELYSRGLDHALAAEAPAEACFAEALKEDPTFALAAIG